MPPEALAKEPAAVFVGRYIGWILVVPGAIALIAAVTLMVEKVRMLEDPTRVPSCTIDAVLACGAVMNSNQAEAFGIPNPLLGIAGFAALVAFGTAILGGSDFPRWLWLAIQAGVTFAVLFVHWLVFQSVYRIESLCPYCMVVWVMTITAFIYVTAHNIAEARLPAARFVVRYHGVILTAWLTILTLVIGEAFWDHWRSKL